MSKHKSKKKPEYLFIGDSVSIFWNLPHTGPCHVHGRRAQADGSFKKMECPLCELDYEEDGIIPLSCGGVDLLFK